MGFERFAQNLNMNFSFSWICFFFFLSRWTIAFFLHFPRVFGCQNRNQKLSVECVKLHELLANKWREKREREKKKKIEQTRNQKAANKQIIFYVPQDLSSENRKFYNINLYDYEGLHLLIQSRLQEQCEQERKKKSKRAKKSTKYPAVCCTLLILIMKYWYYSYHNEKLVSNENP